MTRCDLCDSELHDDPHWHDALEVLVCADCCPNEGCLQFSPATGLLPDDSNRSRPGDDRANTHGPIVPVAGELHA